jgi:hypothetical protein
MEGADHANPLLGPTRLPTQSQYLSIGTNDGVDQDASPIPELVFFRPQIFIN